jgi:hypothetical protein
MLLKFSVASVSLVWDAARLCIKSPGNCNYRQHTAATPSKIEKQVVLFILIY